MFEQYTERARRAAFFFARYYASQSGTEYIEIEHLLLGLLQEDPVLKSSLPPGAAEEVRAQVEGRYAGAKPTSTSVDMPLSNEVSRALVFSADEAERLRHANIDTGHLVLGVLRTETSFAASLLKERGINLAVYREVVRQSAPPGPGGWQLQFTPGTATVPRTRAIDRVVEWYESETVEAAAPSLGPSVNALRDLMERTATHLESHSDEYGELRLKRKPWSRKEAIGHLVDWAVVHQVWFARALTESKVQAGGYPGDEWVAAQDYGGYSWQAVVDLWAGLNRLIVHVLARIPESKVDIPCRVGLDEPVPLSQLVSRYVAHVSDLMGQILAHL